MWGGISEGGFSAVMFHPEKKVKTAEWCKAIRLGKLTSAIRALSPVNQMVPGTF